MDLLATHSNPKYHEHSNTTKIQKEQGREEEKILIRARVRVLCNLLRQASPISVKRWRREFKSLAKGVESDPDFWELVGASTGVLGFGLGLLCVYLTMPASDYSVLKLPRSIEDLRILRYGFFGDLLLIFPFDLMQWFSHLGFGLFWIDMWIVNFEIRF